MKRALTIALVTLALLLGSAAKSRAFFATTHAGLTERAALASSLEEVFRNHLALPLGLFEPLALYDKGATLAGEELQVAQRLAMLDPEGGYRPQAGRQSALAWLVAGAVLEGVPADRERNHFYDPTRPSGKGGLYDAGPRLGREIESARLGVSSVAAIWTGSAFDGTGMAAPDWVLAPRSRNSWGLARFVDERVLSASAERPAARAAALARALLAAGAIVHVLEDSGDPSHVRNDYRIAFEREGGVFERFIAQVFGRVGLPDFPLAPTAPEPLRLRDLFADGQGRGLAERTQRDFLSPGTLDGVRYAAPAITVNPSMTPAEPSGGYLGGPRVRHLAHVRRQGARVTLDLDERCLADYAIAILPDVARTARRALDHLFRSALSLQSASASAGVSVLAEPSAELGAGTISLFADDDQGARRLLVRRTISSAEAAQIQSAHSPLLTAGRPAWARHATALFAGQDAVGEPFALIEEADLKDR